jgi:hypothetical protein
MCDFVNQNPNPKPIYKDASEYCCKYDISVTYYLESCNAIFFLLYVPNLPTNVKLVGWTL